MLGGKELVSQFKAAAWRTPEEIDDFVALVRDPQSGDLLKLLEIVAVKPAEAGAHRQRLIALGKLVEKNPDRALFGPFVKALKTPEPALRTALAAMIPMVSSAGELPALIEHLRSPDVQLRQSAARALQGMGASKPLFDLLSRAVGESAFAGRTEAMDVLAGIARHQSVPALASAIAAGTIPEKVHAVRLLGDPAVMGKESGPALRTLAAVLAAQPPAPEPVLIQAVLSYSALCTEDDWFETLGPLLDVDAVGVVKSCVDGLRRFSSPRVIAALERKLRGGPRAIRLAVVGALEVIGDDSVLPPLVEALGHKQPQVRTRAGEVLKSLSMGKKLDAARTVVSLLRSRDVHVRRMATEVIRSVPDPDQSLWPKLMGALRAEQFWVRERVIEALVELAGVHLVPHLVALLGDGSDVVRRFAANALGRIRDPKALRALVQTATSDRDWWVKEVAIEAVAAIGDPRAVPYVVHLLANDPELQPACLQALTTMGAKDAAAQVAPLCASPSSDVRLAAVRFLDKVDASEHASAVARLVEDPDPRVRSAVREILSRRRVALPGQASAAVPLLDRLLIQLAHQEGDDLIVAPGKPVFMKKVGRTSPVTEAVLSEEQVRSLLLPHLSREQIAALEAMQDVDYSHEVKSEGLRFRANVFQQLGGLSGVFRRIRGTLPALEKLGLPPIVQRFADLKNGLVLVGGPTGHGKSTTLAALIDHINRTRAVHIISLEDPIEVIHRRDQSLVNQREVGAHTRSFAAALRSTLREDPDVILVGEMRDLPTIEFTVVAAETGHLVFGTVHTVSAAASVDRLISAFPAGQQSQVRSTLADSLRAVVCQYLLKERNGTGRVLAVELMLNNDAVANLIRKGKAFQIPSIIATSREQGMQLMDQDLLRLLKEGRISAADAYVKAVSKKELEPFVEEEEKQARSSRALQRKGT